jgi:hypothetical protein
MTPERRTQTSILKGGDEVLEATGGTVGNDTVDGGSGGNGTCRREPGDERPQLSAPRSREC